MPLGRAWLGVGVGVGRGLGFGLGARVSARASARDVPLGRARVGWAMPRHRLARLVPHVEHPAEVVEEQLG